MYPILYPKRDGRVPAQARVKVQQIRDRTISRAKEVLGQYSSRGIRLCTCAGLASSARSSCFRLGCLSCLDSTSPSLI